MHHLELCVYLYASTVLGEHFKVETVVTFASQSLVCRMQYCFCLFVLGVRISKEWLQIFWEEHWTKLVCAIVVSSSPWVSYALFQSHYSCDCPSSQLALNFKPWRLIFHLCSSSQFWIDATATHSSGFSRTTMCRMRSSTPRHSSPPRDTRLTSGSSGIVFFSPLRCPNFVSSQKPRKIEGRRNRLTSLDCRDFAPAATLPADETELKGRPVEVAPLIANLFCSHTPVFESALSLFYSWLHHPAVLTEATAGFRYTGARPSASRTLFSLKLWPEEKKNKCIQFVPFLFLQLSNGRRWRAEEETANLSFWPQPASALHGSWRCRMGLSSVYVVRWHL